MPSTRSTRRTVPAERQRSLGFIATIDGREYDIDVPESYTQAQVGQLISAIRGSADHREWLERNRPETPAPKETMEQEAKRRIDEAVAQEHKDAGEYTILGSRALGAVGQTVARPFTFLRDLSNGVLLGDPSTRGLIQNESDVAAYGDTLRNKELRRQLSMRPLAERMAYFASQGARGYDPEAYDAETEAARSAGPLGQFALNVGRTAEGVASDPASYVGIPGLQFLRPSLQKGIAAGFAGKGAYDTGAALLSEHPAEELPGALTNLMFGALGYKDALRAGKGKGTPTQEQITGDLLKEAVKPKQMTLPGLEQTAFDFSTPAKGTPRELLFKRQTKIAPEMELERPAASPGDQQALNLAHEQQALDFSQTRAPEVDRFVREAAVVRRPEDAAALSDALSRQPFRTMEDYTTAFRAVDEALQRTGGSVNAGGTNALRERGTTPGKETIGEAQTQLPAESAGVYRTRAPQAASSPAATETHATASAAPDGSTTTGVTASASRPKAANPILDAFLSPFDVTEIPEVGGPVIKQGSLGRATRKSNDLDAVEAGRSITETVQRTKGEQERRLVEFENSRKSAFEAVGRAFIEAKAQNPKLTRAQFDDEFVRRIDGDLGNGTLVGRDDPRRYAGVGPEMERALRAHDELTDSRLAYIKANEKAMGKSFGQEFGITETGYFPHRSDGRWVLTTTEGDYLGNFRTANDARAYGIQLRAQDPSLRVEEPTLRGYDSVVKFSSPVPREKRFGSLMQREGYSIPFSRDYRKAMTTYDTDLVRSVELTKMVKAIEGPLLTLKERGLGGEAEKVQLWVDAVFGKPSLLERRVGDFLSNNKWFRENVEHPEYALRTTVRTVTQIQSLLKLAGVPRQAINNIVQPLNSLYPYTTTEEFVSAYKRALSRDGRLLAKEAGLGRDQGKNIGILDETGPVNRPTTGLAKLNQYGFHARGSAFAQRVGFMYGYDRATALLKGTGIPDEIIHERAVANGRRWAEAVEYDSSVWNAGPALRGWAGRLFGQYRPFMFKNLEETANYFRKREGQTGFQYTGQLTKGLGVRALGGGSKAFGGAFIGVPVAAALTHLWMDYTGEKDGGKAAETALAIYLGLPNMLGADLSGGFNVFDLPYGHTAEEVTFNTLAGPTGGLVADAFDALMKGETADTFARRVTPVAKQVEAIGQMGAETPVASVGRGQALPIAPKENIMRALGFAPSTVVGHFDLGPNAVSVPPPLTVEDILGLSRRR